MKATDEKGRKFKLLFPRSSDAFAKQNVEIKIIDENERVSIAAAVAQTTTKCEAKNKSKREFIKANAKKHQKMICIAKNERESEAQLESETKLLSRVALLIIRVND